MVVLQKRSNRKPTGGRYKKLRVRRLAQKGSHASLTRIGTDDVRTSRTKGGNEKSRHQASETVNLYDPTAKKFVKAKMTTAVENVANRQYVRRNIITKGAIVETDKGKAKITSRPGQESQINAVLIT